jgi:hypothetical protein
VHAAEIADCLIMVAWDEDHTYALADTAQQFLEDIVVALRPMGAATDAPEVDDVANKIDRIGIVVAQEIEQRLCLSSARPEVHVGDKQRPIAALRLKGGVIDAFVSGHAQRLAQSRFSNV